MTWLPLTTAQRGLFFAHEIDPSSPAYSTAEVVEFDRRVDAGRLTAALTQAHAEFESLRTRFRTGADGPEQRVLPPADVPLEVISAAGRAEAEAWMADALASPFDLAAGRPTKSALLRLPEADWWFHAAHHVVLDGHGYLQLARRVAALYRGDADPATTTRLADVVNEDTTVPDDAAFWEPRLERMRGRSTLAHGVADGPAPRSRRVVLDIDDDTRQAMRSGARRLGVPWTHLATAAFAGYLGRLAGEDQIRIGVPQMNRMAAGTGVRACARTVCTAVNVVPVQTPASGLAVAELVGAIADELAAVTPHARHRQEDLARVLAQHGDARLFGPQVNLLPFAPEVDFGSAHGRIRNLSAGPVDDMTWCLRGVLGRGPLRLEIDAHPALYDTPTTEAHARRLRRWLGVFADANPQDAVDHLPLLDEDELTQVLVTFNDTERPRTARTLGEAFETQTHRTPDALAVIHDGQAWTYAQLAARADAIAARIDPGSTVGVFLHRGLDLYAAVHGVHRAASSYAPLDPDLPDGRVAGLIGQAGLDAVVTSHDLAGRLPEGTVTIVLDDIEAAPATFVPHFADPDTPAYILFTSGSTGRPKGVVVHHRAIDNRLAWMQHHLPLAPEERVLHKTPISFDVSVWELYWPLQVGATVVIADPGGHRDPRHLAALIAEHEVTVAHFVPSMLRMFLADAQSVAQTAASALRHLVCSGEALDPALVRRTHQALGIAPVNLYGPTEAAVDVTAWDTNAERDTTEVPIGRPVWNTRAYVLDAGRRPLPVGARGELYIAGIQLAAGYLARPDLTAESFVPDPFVPGERMYRTKDAARWRDDGALVYLGRIDDQVKIRGQRVEPGEVEHVLAGVRGVRDVAVVARPGPAGDLCLVAFIVGTVPEERLREAAEHALGDAMVPTLYVTVETLPLTPSGKTDRGALRDRPLPDEQTAAGAPDDLLTERVTQAMTHVIARPVGADDDFFRIGGSSLAALRLVADLERILGITVTFRDVYAAPSPRRLAALVAGRDPASVGAGEELAPLFTLRHGDADRPPLFMLPPAGGLGWCYTGLLRHLPAAQPVHALQADGMDGASIDEPDDLTAWASRMYDRIRAITEGPFHLAGWSVGGMLAHTVAALAGHRGHRVGVVALLDAYPSEQWRALPPPTESDTLRALMRIAGIEGTAPGTVVDRATARAILLDERSALSALPDPVIDAVLRTVVMATRLVRTGEHPHGPHDAVLFVAGAPREEDWLDPAGWAKHIGGAIDVHTLEATHADLVREPAVARIGAVLSERIAAWN